MSWWNSFVLGFTGREEPDDGKPFSPVDPVAWTALKVAQDLNAKLAAELARTKAELEAAQIDTGHWHDECVAARNKLATIAVEERQWDKLNGEVRWLRSRLGMSTVVE